MGKATELGPSKTRSRGVAAFRWQPLSFERPSRPTRYPRVGNASAWLLSAFLLERSTQFCGEATQQG